jgi:hypothetical protein
MHGKRTSRKVKGYQRWRLETRDWVPVENDAMGRLLRPPGRVWMEPPKDLLLPRAKLPKELRRGLGFVDPSKPGVEALENALNELADAYPVLTDAPSSVVPSAEWLQLKLEAILKRAERQAEFSRETPFLLAQCGNSPR